VATLNETEAAYLEAQKDLEEDDDQDDDFEDEEVREWKKKKREEIIAFEKEKERLAKSRGTFSLIMMLILSVKVSKELL